MAGASLLTLLDDIATVLDDVALMSKMAAKKTAGVLGDDLALNAQQVSGVASEREIPVVWAVAKGSFKNKLILVPSALLISAIIPWLIMPLLLIGGLFLCFEGAEKVLEKVFPHFHPHEEKEELVNTGESIEEYEKRKVAGAIRTDFILSAEIIVIALGTVTGASLVTQILVVSLIAVIMTIGVYGLVAGIVKLDDLGFYLEIRSKGKGWMAKVGSALVAFAPKLMKLLTIVGTAAMFLVGGGIVVHNVPAIHHFVEPIIMNFSGHSVATAILPILLNGIIGFVAGLIVVAVWAAVEKIRGH
ncbi:membrane protein [Vibrio alginolyticus]|nr:membrane protein [Vibrio alginolyticus]BCB49744.1 membrane protein [Vibrio alginolyticus]BCB54346.1 membrane protein [Vibrio alginolyticus]BCB58949.1 membrane protein [Vibrio alginolyticus]